MDIKRLNLVWGLVVVALLTAVGYLLYVNYNDQKLLSQYSQIHVPEYKAASINTDSNNTPANTETQQADTSKPGWATFTSAKYGFEFMYPEGFKETSDKNYLGLFTGSGDQMDNNINLRILNKKLDPNNIEGMYGKVDTKKVSIGNRTGYEYMDGDAGCGATVVLTSLSANTTLQVDFGGCWNEDNSKPGQSPLYNNTKLINEILATFKFQ